MADRGTAMRTSDLVLTLVQSGGIAGLEMRAVLKLSELPPVDADARLTPVRAGQGMRRTAPGGTSGPTAARRGGARSASEATS